MAFLGTLALVAAARDRWNEVRLALIGLVAFAGGALLAAVRSFDGLAPPGRRAIYVASLGLLVALTVMLLAAGRDRTSPSSG